MPDTAPEPVWIVPTETSSLAVAQTSSVPAMFDFENDIGDPVLASASPGSGSLCGDTAEGSYKPVGGSVVSGIWYAEPTECGPYSAPSVAGTPAATPGTATSAMTVQTKPFDLSVTSNTGDLWQVSVNPAASFTPVVANPGQTVTIDVTFTPSGAPGTRSRAICTSTRTTPVSRRSSTASTPPASSRRSRTPTGSGRALKDAQTVCGCRRQP